MLFLSRNWRAFLIAIGFAAMVTGCIYYNFTAPRFPNSRNEVVARLRDPNDYAKQHQELWMCALKGIGTGAIHYVGSDEEFDYFRVEGKRGFFRLLHRSSALTANRRFEVGHSTPFTVGTDNSPYIPAIRSW